MLGEKKIRVFLVVYENVYMNLQLRTWFNFSFVAVLIIHVDV